MAISTLHPDTASSDLFAAFEALASAAGEQRWRPEDLVIPRQVGATFTAPPPEKSLEVTAQFDARAQVGDQRGRAGKPVLLGKVDRPGPLREIYNTYARRDERGEDVKRVLAGEEEDLSLMSRLETTQFAEDFGVCPGLLRRVDVLYAFKHSDRPDYGPNAPHNRDDQLNFPEFVAFLVQCAILAYDHPRHKSEVPDDVAAVDALLETLSCTSADTRKLRARLGEMARMAKARNDNKSDRKWEHVSRASLGGPTPEAMRRVASGKIDPHLVARAMRFDADQTDKPKWTEFAQPALDCGTLLPGETRRFRVVLRNRNLCGNMTVKVDVEGCPCVDATFAEGPLAPGLPRVIEITAGAQAPGEWLGSINITATPVCGDGGAGGARALEGTHPRRPSSGEVGREDEDSVGRWPEGTTPDKDVYHEEDECSAGGDDHDHASGRENSAAWRCLRDDGERGGAATWVRAGERVYVPVYLNCVAKEREVVTRAGTTIGISGYVTPSGRRAEEGAVVDTSGGGERGGDAPSPETERYRPAELRSGRLSSAAVELGTGGVNGGVGGAGGARPVSAPMRGPTSFRRHPEPNVTAEQRLTMKQPRVSGGGGRLSKSASASPRAGGGGPGAAVAVTSRAPVNPSVLAEANMARATVRSTTGEHRPPSGRAQYRLSTGGLRY